MLAGAARTYARRYGVRAGETAALFATHDGAYDSAFALAEAGVRISAIVDPRADSPAMQKARAAGFDVRARSVDSGTAGRGALHTIEIRAADGTGRGAPCPQVWRSAMTEILSHRLTRRAALLGMGAALATPAIHGASAQGAPIKVGVLHSLSGTMAISETALRDTVLMMVEGINSRGGLLGRIGHCRRQQQSCVVAAQLRHDRFGDLVGRQCRAGHIAAALQRAIRARMDAFGTHQEAYDGTGFAFGIGLGAQWGIGPTGFFGLIAAASYGMRIACFVAGRRCKDVQFPFEVHGWSDYSLGLLSGSVSILSGPV
jgi:hypothetical protein